MNKIIKKITYLALLLSMMPVIRPFTINFNYSDILFLLVLLLMFLNIRKQEFDFNVFNNSYKTGIYFLGVLLLFFGFGISSIINGSNMNFVGINLQYFFVFIIVPLIIKNSGINLKKSIIIILISMVITIIFGIYIYYFTSDLSYSIGGRMGSFFKNPNTLAKNISLLIPASLYLVYKHNKLYLFIMIIFIVGLTISSSFGGIIASTLSLFLFFLISRKFLSFIRILPIVIISLLVLIRIFGFPIIFENRILSLKNNFDLQTMGSFSAKSQLINDSFNVINSNPIIGVGAGNYLDSILGDTTVHNTYLLIWAEGGIFSILGFGLILGSFLFSVFEFKNEKYRFATSLTVFLILIINFITNVHVYNRYVFIALFLLLILPSEEAEKNMLSQHYEHKYLK